MCPDVSTRSPGRHAFVVAMEYRGAEILVQEGQARVPLREHAYDIGTAALADHPLSLDAARAEHPPSHGALPRVAFPYPSIGWNTTPQSPRCVACEVAVIAIVRDAITHALSTCLSSQPP
jgi:hypothetical protein